MLNQARLDEITIERERLTGSGPVDPDDGFIDTTGFGDGGVENELPESGSSFDISEDDVAYFNGMYDAFGAVQEGRQLWEMYDIIRQRSFPNAADPNLAKQDYTEAFIDCMSNLRFWRPKYFNSSIGRLCQGNCWCKYCTLNRNYTIQFELYILEACLKIWIKENGFWSIENVS